MSSGFFGGVGGGGPSTAATAAAAKNKKKGGPPPGYVPGIGRGAAGFSTRSDVGPAAQVGVAASSADDDAAGGGGDVGVGSRSAEARAAKLAASQRQREGGGGQFDDSKAVGDDEDDEADRIWAAIDERVKNKRKRRGGEGGDVATASDNPRARIGAPFRDLKAKLADVSEAEWATIPDVGDYSLKYKQQRRQDVFTPLTDSLLDQRAQLNADATAGTADARALAGTTAAAAAAGGDDETSAKTTGFRSVVTNMSGLGAARGTVLGMSLDKMSDSVAGQTNVDPKGYLTSLAGSGTTISSATNVADVHKARLLLQSVRDTNPEHGPGWIAAARVEEAAGKMPQARKIIQEACETCPGSEDVWLEAARLHQAQAKSILAAAVKRNPRSVKLFLKAADLEVSDQAKRAVLRKALEANPTSVQLWKAAVELEDADNARILLSVAVEKVPTNVELWLALARLESYENAQKVLNKARKAMPAERSIWIAAAKLEESQEHLAVCRKVVNRAVASLSKNDAVVTRAQWLHEAEAAEAAGAPITSEAIIKATIGKDVDDQDRYRTWSDDAQQALGRGSVATARAILSHALSTFPTKRGLWMQAVELERKHGTPTTLDEILAAASERLPRVEIFWLLRAKERWLAGEVDKSREILAKAFELNPDSEAVWLAAAKLEWETGESERASLLLQRARERAPTDRVYMKSALFEREQKNFDAALDLIEQGIAKYPKFPKLYMMGGQICSDDLVPKTKSNLDRARKFYQRGLQECPSNTVLWTLASRLEERASSFDENKGTGNGGAGATSTKARALLDLGRLKNPKNPELWLESVRLERRAGNTKLSDTLLAKALQECPSSGLLLAESIRVAPRVEQKSKSSQAIKRCPDDPRVIVAVASLFASERKNDKARKWLDRAVILDPDNGDSWTRYYAFEKRVGTTEQQSSVKDRCIAAEPKHGEIWTSVTKHMSNRGKSVGECLELAAQKLKEDQHENGRQHIIN